MIGVVGMGNKKETAKNRAQFNMVVVQQKEMDRGDLNPRPPIRTAEDRKVLFKPPE